MRKLKVFTIVMSCILLCSTMTASVFMKKVGAEVTVQSENGQEYDIVDWGKSSVTPQNATSCDTVVWKLKLKDEYIDKVHIHNICIQYPNGYCKYEYPKYNGEEWTCTYELSEYGANGSYQLLSYEYSYYQGDNNDYIVNAPENMKMNISGLLKEDITDPIIDMSKVTAKSERGEVGTVKADESLYIFVPVKEDESGVEHLWVSFYKQDGAVWKDANCNMDFEVSSFFVEKVEGGYVFNFRPAEYFENPVGNYVISMLQASDNSNNANYYEVFDWQTDQLKDEYSGHTNLYFSVIDSNIPEHQHLYDEGVKTTQEGCEKYGIITSNCTICGTTKRQVTQPLGHREIIDKAISATCTKSGLTAGKHCSVCNTILVKQRQVPINKHSIVIRNVKTSTYFKNGYTGDGVCSVCGTVVNKGKSIVKLILKRPSIKLKKNKKNIIVSFKKIKGAKKYQISYKLSTAKKWSIKTVKTNKYKISKLKKGKKYKIRVRAIAILGKKKAYSPYSKVKTIKK